ncbi:MAG: hypothetical protein JO217_12545 [Acidobacteriaceae bacterium]|nr:hypothetical protein [Acidobacteriaceae bacterium]MBV9443504.1 hypothetical protein [Acidobacteriaceae bacterium]
MDSSTSCTERERLLRNFADAVTIHSYSVSRMAQLAGTRLSGAFTVAKKQASETKLHVESARQEFEAHVREHGC